MFVILEVDVIFVVGVILRNVVEIFCIMKDILVYVINIYGIGSIRYGVILFGMDVIIE